MANSTGFLPSIHFSSTLLADFFFQGDSAQTKEGNGQVVWQLGGVSVCVLGKGSQVEMY